MLVQRLRTRLRVLVVLTSALVVATPSLTVTAAAATCGGKDLIAEFARTAPALHTRIEAEAARTENTEALLWRVERAGSAPSHLFGTVHLSDARVATPPPKAMAAIAGAKTVALEVADLSPKALVAAMGKSGAKMFYGGDARLDRKLEAAEFALVRGKLASAGLPDQVAPMVRPWLAYMLLSVSDCERQRSASGAQVLDMRIAAEAKKRGIPVVGLETLESQLAAMAAVDEGQQVEMLRATLKHVDRADDLMETMLQLYLDRRMGRAWPLTLVLAEQAGVAASAFSGFESELVVKRNHGMRDKALPLVKEGGAFIGVGALHLVGKTGLVTLLRQAGFTVTPVE
jgi:hypothetical protein